MNRIELFWRQTRQNFSFFASFQRVSNIHIGSKTRIEPFAVLKAAGGPLEIGSDCYIDRHAMILCNGGSIKIGNHCSFNPFCMIYGQGGLTIGNDVRISTGVVIIPSNHGFYDRNQKICDHPLTKKGIVIEDDCWIGANAVILDGVHIGKGSVIGAGSIVASSVEPYSIVAGNPAKLIKKRD